MQFILSLILFIFVSASTYAQNLSFDDSPHKVEYFKSYDGTKLQILDWGGDGDAIIFLAGLFANAHVFDHFAPLLTDSFHVVGLTRRGIGASDHPDSGYDTHSIAKDIASMMDSLKIQKAHFIGWSAGGHEIFRFAELFPNRVQTAVFLDCECPGYADELPATPSSLPKVPEVPSPNWGEVDIYDLIARYLRQSGYRPTGYILDSFKWDSLGRATGYNDNEDKINKYYEDARKEDFPIFSKPALSLLSKATHPINIYGNYYYEMNSNDQKKAQQMLSFENMCQDSLKAQWCRLSKNIEVVVLEGAPHAIHLWNPFVVANHVKVFLNGID